MAKAIKHNFEILSAFLIRLLAIPRPLWFLTGIGTTLRIDFIEEGTYGAPEDECGLMVLVDEATGRRYRIRGHELANLRICDGTLPDKIKSTNDFSEYRGAKRFIDCGITEAYDLARVKLTLQGRIISYNRWAGSFTPLYINKAYKGYAEYLRKKISGEVTLGDHITLLQSGIEDGYSDYKYARYYPVFSLSRE
jgi:hypothetical protein